MKKFDKKIALYQGIERKYFNSTVKLPSPNDIPMSFILKHGLIAAKNANGIQRLSIPVDNSWQYGESYEAGSYLEVDKKMNQDAIENFLKN
ncbi:hypothetical protein [Enterococcus cecorum]|uniref:hypothetical protein n=1 Tax=Enterococcus cecorum TaxID=44008 RepID=UPI003F520CAB